MTSTNRGIRYALDTMQADYVVIMNNDVVVKGPWLQNMLDAMKDYDLCGYTGRKLLFWRRHAKTKYLEGSCIMIKKEVFANIGLLDPLFITGYYSDDDFCLRASLSGFKLGVLNNGLTQTYIKHHEGQTFGIKKLDNMRDEYIRFTNKWEKQRANKLVDVYLRRWRFNPHSLGYRTTLLTHRVLKLGPYRRAS